MLLFGVAAAVAADTLEPEVTIAERHGERIEQYRVAGQVYMIKVTPQMGLPYYLVDNDGDGILETRRNRLGAGFVAPRWVLFRWK